MTRGYYQNGFEGHIIHELYPAIPLSFKIVETPCNVILPVSVKRLENINVLFRDQNNGLIDLKDETVNIRLSKIYDSGIQLIGCTQCDTDQSTVFFIGINIGEQSVLDVIERRSS